MNLRYWNRAGSRLAVLMALASLLSLPALAELGGDIRSVQADQQRMHATRHVNQAQVYAVHEIRTATNGLVREYLSPAGKVFAVSYHGQSLGEGNRLLASYSQQISPVVQSMRGGQHRNGPVTVRLPNVIYHASGHMRSYTVHAYLPGSIPEGVNPEDLP